MTVADDLLHSPYAQIALDATHKVGLSQPHIAELMHYLIVAGKHAEHSKMLAAKWCKERKKGLL